MNLFLKIKWNLIENYPHDSVPPGICYFVWLHQHNVIPTAKQNDTSGKRSMTGMGMVIKKPPMYYYTEG